MNAVMMRMGGIRLWWRDPMHESFFRRQKVSYIHYPRKDCSLFRRSYLSVCGPRELEFGTQLFPPGFSAFWRMP